MQCRLVNDGDQFQWLVLIGQSPLADQPYRDLIRQGLRRLQQRISTEQRAFGPRGESYGAFASYSVNYGWSLS